VDYHAARLYLMLQKIHVVGAGLAGLAAAVRLAGSRAEVVLYEAAGHAGGRCRSYHDQVLDAVIDNGNHLLLSANHAALTYVAVIGASAKLGGPAHAEFPFVDIASGKRWTLQINEGSMPWWVFDRARRVPETSARDYLSFARLLLLGRAQKTVCSVVRCSGAVYDRLARPLWLAALNTDPKEASANLARRVTWETLGRGGRACRPLFAPDGLGAAFVEPALSYLRAHGVGVQFGNRLRGIGFERETLSSLDFGDEQVPVRQSDGVILAVPSTVAADFVPGLTTPGEFRAIVNAHFRVVPPSGLPPIIGIVNGTIEWLFAYRHRLSVTISCADRLLDMSREALAEKIWNEVAVVAGLPKAMPPWQIVRERRATFAATPAEHAKRPGTITRWRNLFLAGDWTNTGLPATIEGAVRSGNRAADLAYRL
jgi:squalene-associated FAD-dependent desaturase